MSRLGLGAGRHERVRLYIYNCVYKYIFECVYIFIEEKAYIRFSIYIIRVSVQMNSDARE